jgi:predicted nucleic acid-binding Zn ribbon protein
VSVNEFDDATPEPTPLSDALARVRDELGLPDADAVRALSERWREVVGDDVAAHAHLDAVRDGIAAITVDSALWATQLRYLETAIVERASDLVGPDLVVRIRVRVTPS